MAIKSIAMTDRKQSLEARKWLQNRHRATRRVLGQKECHGRIPMTVNGRQFPSKKAACDFFHLTLYKLELLLQQQQEKNQMNLYLIEYYTKDGAINFAWIKADSRSNAWKELRYKKYDAEYNILIEEYSQVVDLACGSEVIHNLT